jgi:hypothetical protein
MFTAYSYFRSALSLAITLGTFVLSDGARSAEYPVIFTSPDALRKIGIDMNRGDLPKPYKNKCYYYGDGGQTISLTDEFLARFVSKGFTIESACLGLISETRFDPETGRRLATYMLVDKEMIRQRSSEPGAATEELPLQLPPCFKNANPYTDCTFNFGRISGKKLSAEETETYRKLGAAIDTIFANEMKRNKNPQGEFYGKEEALAGFRKYEGQGQPDGSKLDDKLARYSSLSIWVRTSKLPRGYGYALDADGTAGPSLSAAAMSAAISGISKPQISAENLKKALDASK